MPVHGVYECTCILTNTCCRLWHETSHQKHLNQWNNRYSKHITDSTNHEHPPGLEMLLSYSVNLRKMILANSRLVHTENMCRMSRMHHTYMYNVYSCPYNTSTSMKVRPIESGGVRSSDHGCLWCPATVASRSPSSRTECRHTPSTPPQTADSHARLQTSHVLSHLQYHDHAVTIPTMFTYKWLVLWRRKPDK